MRRAHLSGYYSRILSCFFILSDGHCAYSVLRDVGPHRSVLVFVVGITVGITWRLSTRVGNRVLNNEWRFLGAAVDRIWSILNRLPLRRNQKFAFFELVLATFWSSTRTWGRTLLPFKIFLHCIFLSFSETNVPIPLTLYFCSVRTTSFRLELKFVADFGSQLLSVLRVALGSILLGSYQSSLLNRWSFQFILRQTQVLAVVLGIKWQW